MEEALILDLRPESSLPLHQQVYEQIRLAILSGRVRSHQKLPASRQLAQSLGISRTTVTQSYDQLISEGYLEARRGSGTFVCAHVPDDLLYAQTSDLQISDLQTSGKTPSTALPSSRQPSYSQAEQILTQADTPTSKRTLEMTLSHYAQRLLNAVELPDHFQTSLSFRYWRPDFDLFPRKQWQRLLNRHSTKSCCWMTYSSDPMGYEPLRQAIAHYASQVRAVRCTPEQVLITQGTQQALGLIAQVLLNEGDAIALENPGYLSARKVFSAHGGLTFPVSVDSEGLDVSELEALSDQTIPIKLAYVTPSHQFPTGVLMSLPRRLSLLQWAQRTGGLIVEDDYDSAFRYSGRPVPSLQGLDNLQQVLYVGTFSKVMFPGLRLGYLVLPEALVPAFARAKWVCDRQSNQLNQAALADFISQGFLAKHIRKTRSVYEQRRTRLVELLSEISAPFGEIEIVGDPAGLHFMSRLPLPAHVSSAQALQLAAQVEGVSLFPVAPYHQPSGQIARERSKESAKESTRGKTRTPSKKSTSPSDQTRCALGPAESSFTGKGEFIFGFGGLSVPAIEAAINRLRPLFSSRT